MDQIPETLLLALEKLQELVLDHGDPFRWSLSQKGRVWLTLTHWAGEKYNTSVEVPTNASIVDTIQAIAVLVVAHSAKCFGTQVHQDTWAGIDATRDSWDDALSVLHTRSAVGSNSAPTEEQPKRAK